MDIDWNIIRQKVIDVSIDVGKEIVREADHKTKELEKAAEREAKEKGQALSDDTYEMIDDMYDSLEDACYSLYDIEEKYHSRYKDNGFEYNQKKENTEESNSSCAIFENELKRKVMYFQNARWKVYNHFIDNGILHLDSQFEATVRRYIDTCYGDILYKKEIEHKYFDSGLDFHKLTLQTKEMLESRCRCFDSIKIGEENRYDINKWQEWQSKFSSLTYDLMHWLMFFFSHSIIDELDLLEIKPKERRMEYEAEQYRIAFDYIQHRVAQKIMNYISTADNINKNQLQINLELLEFVYFYFMFNTGEFANLLKKHRIIGNTYCLKQIKNPYLYLLETSNVIIKEIKKRVNVVQEMDLEKKVILREIMNSLEHCHSNIEMADKTLGKDIYYMEDSDYVEKVKKIIYNDFYRMLNDSVFILKLLNT